MIKNSKGAIQKAEGATRLFRCAIQKAEGAIRLFRGSFLYSYK